MIRLGEKDYRSEDQDVLEFLSTIFYPHGQGFRKKIAKYIDLEQCLQMEVEGMSGLGESIFQEGIERGIEQGIEQEHVYTLQEQQRANAAEEEVRRLQKKIQRLELEKKK